MSCEVILEVVEEVFELLEVAEKGDPGPSNHQALDSLQGGTVTERYHLTAAEVASIAAKLDKVAHVIPRVGSFNSADVAESGDLQSVTGAATITLETYTDRPLGFQFEVIAAGGNVTFAGAFIGEGGNTILPEGSLASVIRDATTWRVFNVSSQAFNPSDIASFIGEYDFGVTADLYQDAAKTTPVTVGSDPIGAIEDKRSVGPDVTQSTVVKKPPWDDNVQNSLGAGLFNGDKADSNLTSMLAAPSAMFTDDNFDILIVAKGAAQTIGVLAAQHDGSASVGRTYFMSTGSIDTSKARFFMNNGTSHIIESTTSVFGTGNFHILRIHSDGAGNTGLAVDGGADEATIVGETWTPLNVPLSVGATSYSLTGVGASGFAGHIAAVYPFNAELSAGDYANMVAYIQNYWGI